MLMDYSALLARSSALNKQGWGANSPGGWLSSIRHFYPLSTERRVLVGWWIGNQSVLSIIKPLRRGSAGGPRPVMTFLPLPSNIYKTISSSHHHQLQEEEEDTRGRNFLALNDDEWDESKEETREISLKLKLMTGEVVRRQGVVLQWSRGKQKLHTEAW